MGTGDLGRQSYCSSKIEEFTLLEMPEAIYQGLPKLIPPPGKLKCKYVPGGGRLFYQSPADREQRVITDQIQENSGPIHKNKKIFTR